MRQQDRGLLRNVIEGKMEGIKEECCEKKNRDMLSELMEAVGYGEMKRKTEDQKRLN
jgi:hypothetical protein